MMPTALIVDDEPEANHLLARLIQIKGYQTVSVYTGDAALAFLEHNQADVIFLDLMLPDINGYDVCRTIKAQPRTSLVPVVVVTARLAAENRLQSLRLGANGYVCKPYTPDQIFLALAAAGSYTRELEQFDGHGQFDLGSEEDVFAQELAHLHSLLVARTPLPVSQVTEIIAALRAIGSDARVWGVQQRARRVASARFEMLSDRLCVHIRDESGWFAGGDLAEAAEGFQPHLDEVFDEATSGPDGPETVLVKYYRAPATSSSSH